MMLAKIIGKWITYIGLLASIGGIHIENPLLIFYGGAMVTLGCILHEVHEK